MRRWFLWLPVAFAGGIWACFRLPREPGFLACVLGSTVIAVLHIIASGSGTSARSVTGILLAVAAGSTASKLRIEWVRAPVLPVSMTKAEITGRIVGLGGRADRGAHAQSPSAYTQ